MQMPSAIRVRPLQYDERMSTVGHLDELRTRMLVSLLAVAVAFGICFWQNQRLLHLINAPLANETQLTGAVTAVGRSARLYTNVQRS